MSLALNGKQVRRMDPHEVLVAAIKHELLDVLGPSPAQSIDFYVDPAIASISPLEYERKLKETLGHGGDIVLLGMRNRVCGLAGKAPKSACIGVAGCLGCLTEAYSKSAVRLKITPDDVGASVQGDR